MPFDVVIAMPAKAGEKLNSKAIKRAIDFFAFLLIGLKTVVIVSKLSPQSGYRRSHATLAWRGVRFRGSFRFQRSALIAEAPGFSLQLPP